MYDETSEEMLSKVKFPSAFFRSAPVATLAKELIGCTLFTLRPEGLSGGVITECEAYAMQNDRACHAYDGKRTPRNESMYGPAGTAYVYLCYGIHHLFNIVCGPVGQADAILIRAIEPTHGLELMSQRRKGRTGTSLTVGPGNLSQALSIRQYYNGQYLSPARIFVVPKPKTVSVEASPRIGIDYAGPDKELPWRFVLQNTIYQSKVR